MNDIVLTTFPAHKSRNVGDAMITQSAIELIKCRYAEFEPHIVYREKSLDGFTKRQKHNVIAPGFSVANNTYPDLFPLFEDLDRMKNFFPLGCSFQSTLPGVSAFNDNSYNKETLVFLQSMAERFGPFPCRDQLIVNRLKRLGIPAFYMGDLVLFDHNNNGREPILPKHIGSVVISLQHHIRYIEQVISLMKRIKRRFPDAKRYVSMQSAPNNMYKILAVRAKEIGFEVLEVGGPAENLEVYSNIDLHIGYRLHGHIYFLRQRKPSILLIEDTRAFGFSRTQGTSVGCVDACFDETLIPDDESIDRAMKVLEVELDQGFSRYLQVFDFIDETYRNIVSPYFDEMVDELRLHRTI